ncbi:MAG: DUF169 domain-containing protein [Candidatus Woesearchaeota archaeon]
MKIEEIHKKTLELLKIKGAPVGIKFLKKKSELKKLKILALEEELALCQMLKIASLYEKTRGVYFENIDACVVGSYILGFGMPPKDIKQRWINGFDYKPAIFDKLSSKIEAMPLKKFEAAVFAPLKEFERMKIYPDAVVMFVNSCQAYLLLVGFFDATGKKIKSEFNGHAACEVISAVAKGKSPWLTIPCGGARSIGDAQDDEIWVGMKVDELEMTIKRIEKIKFQYSPPLNQMVMSKPNPKHPLTNLISRKPVK